MTGKRDKKVNKDNQEKVTMSDVTKGLFGLLDIWRCFPNYQLERRLDIFFAYFLPEIMKKSPFNVEYHIDIKHKYDHIIPEFPLLLNKKRANNENERKKVRESGLCEKEYDEKYRYSRYSEKVDYVVIKKDENNNTVYFIELKTTDKSITKDQVERRKKQKPLGDLIAEVFFICDGYDDYVKLIPQLMGNFGVDVKEIRKIYDKVIKENENIKKWHDVLGKKSLEAWQEVAKEPEYIKLFEKWSIEPVYIVPVKEGKQSKPLLVDNNIEVIGFDFFIKTVESLCCLEACPIRNNANNINCGFEEDDKMLNARCFCELLDKIINNTPSFCRFGY